MDSGALGEIRTPDPRIRSPMLYPAELRARAPRLPDLAAEGYPKKQLAGWEGVTRLFMIPRRRITPSAFAAGAAADGPASIRRAYRLEQCFSK
jgi:hypothetical protein